MNAQLSHFVLNLEFVDAFLAACASVNLRFPRSSLLTPNLIHVHRKTFMFYFCFHNSFFLVALWKRRRRSWCRHLRRPIMRLSHRKRSVTTRRRQSRHECFITQRMSPPLTRPGYHHRFDHRVNSCFKASDRRLRHRRRPLTPGR